MLIEGQTVRGRSRAGFRAGLWIGTILAAGMGASSVSRAVELPAAPTAEQGTESAIRAVETAKGAQARAEGALKGSVGARRGDGPPEEVGQWQEPLSWPVIAIHAALLPTGKVLHYSYPDASDGSRAMLWDPETGSFEQVFANTDLFCSGHSFLSDGMLYVTGGNNTECVFQGRFVTHIFDPFTESWTVLEEMSVGRWYPSNVTLGDGRVLIFSGLNQFCVTTPVVEIYTPGKGLEVIPEGERFLSLYPRMHVLTSGRVAHVGPEEITSTFDPATGAWHELTFSGAGHRGSGNSVLIPGESDQVMIMGGYVNFAATPTCERIDFGDPMPQWQPTGVLNFPRAHANAVILPDGQVMIVGGGTTDLYGDPVMEAEMYDPDTEAWTLLPPQVYGRMYHATALLLPDGRVLSAGQDQGSSANVGEIYEPAYLFRGSRPVITAAPEQTSYGATFAIDTPEAAQIGSVVLIRLSTVTHSLNISQRYVELEFVAGAGSELLVVAPPDGNHAPPGYYMLFILTADGVPSEAAILRLGEAETCEGDANGDGTVDPLDSGFVLARFGCMVGQGDPNCDAADQNGDGVVDPLDAGYVRSRFGPCGEQL